MTAVSIYDVAVGWVVLAALVIVGLLVGGLAALRPDERRQAEREGAEVGLIERDLPGMWERADFEGGADEVVRP